MNDVPQLTRQEFVEKLLKERYFIDEDNTWENLIRRVSKHATAKIHKNYENDFYNVINNKDFIPSRMPYMGTENSFSSSCFVFDMEDNWESIFDCLRDAVAVQRFGGGTGYNFSTLRPKGDLINTTKGNASGPLSFMHWFQETFQVLKRAGRKMAAQMAILNIDHPDIEEFIDSKSTEGSLWCFNISVAVTDKFMQAIENDEDWDLTWDGEVRKTLKARYLFNKIVSNAHHMAEPGIIFQDEIDRKNKFPIRTFATNPCLSGDTLIKTNNGIFELLNLVDKLFQVQGMDGNWYNSKAIKTSDSELLYKITLKYLSDV